MSAYVHCPVLLDWCGSCQDCGQCPHLVRLLEDLGVPEDAVTWACSECCKKLGPTRHPITRMLRNDAQIHLGGFYQEEECYFCGTHSPVLQLVFFSRSDWERWREVLLREPETPEPAQPGN